MALQLRRGTNAQRLGMTPANGELIYVTDWEMTTATVDATFGATDTFTLESGSVVSVGQQIKFLDDSQNGLTKNQVYFVINHNSGYGLSLSSGGAAVNLTSPLAAPVQFAETPTDAADTPIGTSVSPLWIGDGVTVGGVIAGAINLDDLLDVQIEGAGGVALENYQHLQYDSADQLWRNVSNVVVPGTLNVFGNTTLGDASGDSVTFNASTVATPNNLNFDSGLLFIDAANNRIGINDATPSEALDVTGNGQFSGDVTVNGGNININGTATTAVQPFLTFSTQADAANSLYGVRGMSALDDPWFVGSGAVGDDQGFLEIATGDNTNGTNSGGQIYVRQYNGQGAGGAPWYGGSGTVQNELTLLDNVGNTSIPNALAVGGVVSANNTTEATNAATGSIITAGGVGIAKKLHVGGTISVDDTLNATSTTSGSIQTDGGVAVAQDIFVGGLGTITGDLAVNGGDLTTTAGTATLFNSTATTVNIGGAATTMSIGNSAGTITIPGNLTVNGTTTTINSQTLLVADKNIEMGVVAVPTDTTADGGGIILKGTTDKSILYDNSSGRWVANIGFNTSGSTIGNIKIADGANDNLITTTTGNLELNGSTGITEVIGDLQVTGNDIKSSSATALTLSGADVAVAGDLTVTGNDIKSSSATALTLSGADVAVAGDLTVTGNDIKSSSATALTLSGADVAVAGDLAVNGTTLTLDADNAGAGANSSIVANRGSSGTDAILTWNEGTGFWVFNKDLFGEGQIVAGTTLGVNGNDIYFNNEDGAAADCFIHVKRPSVADAQIKWNETTDRWQTSVDSSTYLNIPNQNLDSTDSPAFAGATLDAVTVGVDSAQTISTTSGNLVLQTAAGVNAGTITMTAGTNGAINITPNGTGTVVIPTADVTTLDVTNIRALDGTAAASIANSTGAVSITTELTVDNININGNTLISTDTNGAITLDPNGTGNVVCTFSNGGNLTNDRNYVFGAIRNATTQSNGDIWVLDADSGGAGTFATRGISIDNSTDFATKNAGTVVRNYSNTAGFSPRLVFERSRYTSTPATPLTLSSGDTIGTIAGTGYSSTLGWINDTLAFAPAVLNLVTAEAWASNTNLGTQLNVVLAPTATTISTVANLVTVMAANPQTFASRSDAFTWAQGKTGSTQNMSLDVSGNLAVTGDVRVNGNNIQGSGGSNAIDLTSGNTLLTLRSNTILCNTAADATYASINATGSEFVCSGITNYIRTGTSNGVFPPFLARYKRTDTAGSNNNDGAQIILSTGGTSTTDNIARFDAQYKSTGLHTFGISVSSDSFVADTDNVYVAQADKTIIRATPTGTTGTVADVLTIEQSKITAAAPIQFPSYTVAAAGAITGGVGWQIAISDSPTYAGRMAYWSTTATAAWRYIDDNTAI